MLPASLKGPPPILVPAAGLALGLRRLPSIEVVPFSGPSSLWRPFRARWLVAGPGSRLRRLPPPWRSASPLPPARLPPRSARRRTPAAATAGGPGLNVGEADPARGGGPRRPCWLPDPPGALDIEGGELLLDEAAAQALDGVPAQGLGPPVAVVGPVGQRRGQEAGPRDRDREPSRERGLVPPDHHVAPLHTFPLPWGASTVFVGWWWSAAVKAGAHHCVEKKKKKK